MSKKLYGLLLPVLAVVAFASVSAAAQAQIWKPEERAVALRSGNVKLEVENEAGGKTVLECKETLAAANIGEEAEYFAFKPALRECTAPIIVKKWRAVAVNATRANLVLPAEAAKITVAAGCELVVGATTIGAANNFVAGELAVWTIAGTANIKEVPVNCFNKVKAQVAAPVAATVHLAAGLAEVVEP